MGIVQRFERKLQGAVGDAFARVFGGGVVPQEVEAALQQEARDRVEHLGGGILLAPNNYVITINNSDHEELAADRELTTKLSADTCRISSAIRVGRRTATSRSPSSLRLRSTPVSSAPAEPSTRMVTPSRHHRRRMFRRFRRGLHNGRLSDPHRLFPLFPIQSRHNQEPAP